jgi:hypothetical protein
LRPYLKRCRKVMSITTTSLKAAAVVGALALAPVSAEAVTISLSTDGVNYTTVVDSGLPFGSSNGLFGGFFYDVSVFGGQSATQSVLNTTSIAITRDVLGGGDLWLRVSEDNFTTGGPILSFSMGVSSLGGELYGSAYWGDTINSTANQIGSTLSFAGSGVVAKADMTTDFAALSDPFSLTNIFRVSHLDAGRTSFTATTVAAIPLPAGMLLLLSGLGGIALMRRRKDKQDAMA